MNNPELSEAIEAKQNEEENHFNRLPDEVLITIFNKILDLKTLCVCSLVSTRFSSLIPHVHSISFSVPRRKSNSSIVNDSPNPEEVVHHESLPRKLFRFLAMDVVSKPFRFLSRIVRPTKPLPSSLSAFYGDNFRSAVCFLSKFREIRCLELELPSSSHGSNGGGDQSTVIKWRAKFGTKLETFLFLSPTSIHEMNQFTGSESFDNGRDEDEEEESELIGNLLKHRVHLAFQCLKDALVRHRMLLFLIEQHRMLENVVISDSKKQGLLSVRDEQLVELRNWIRSSSATLSSQLRSIEVPVSAKQWYVPVLRLPLSGCVMEGATLVMMGMVDSGGGDDSGGITLAGSFEEAFAEAVAEMMLNHRSRMKTLL